MAVIRRNNALVNHFVFKKKKKKDYISSYRNNQNYKEIDF